MSVPADIREAISLQYAMQKGRRTTAWCLSTGMSLPPGFGIPDVLEDFKHNPDFAGTIYALNRAMDIAHLIYIRDPTEENRAVWLDLEDTLGSLINNMYPLPNVTYNITHEVPKDPFARDDDFVPVKRYDPLGPPGEYPARQAQAGTKASSASARVQPQAGAGGGAKAQGGHQAKAASSARKASKLGSA